MAEEIIMNAISAATRDPRSEPVDEDELKDLDISVDVLTEPEEIQGKEQLNPKKIRGHRRKRYPAWTCCCLTWKGWTPPNSR